MNWQVIDEASELKDECISVEPPCTTPSPIADKTDEVHTKSIYSTSRYYVDMSLALRL